MEVLCIVSHFFLNMIFYFFLNTIFYSKYYPDSQFQKRDKRFGFPFQDSSCEITKADDIPHAEDCNKAGKTSASRDCKEEHQTSTRVNEVQTSPNPKEDESGDNSTGQEKVFKRPDKVVPCPRCNSFDTKFCYFNNYNVNQPRHFCKNCQRYWTAGGTMRNVPVGAGRRKNKHLAFQYRHVLLSSEGGQTVRIESPDLSDHQLLSCDVSATAFGPPTGNGRVIKFGPETPLCESMETVLNIKDQKRCVEMVSTRSGEIGEEPCGSSMTATSIWENELPENVMQKEGVGMPGSCNQLNPPHPMHCYPVAPWVFPLNSGWNNPASTPTTHYSSESSHPNPVQWCPTPMLGVPGFFPQGIPLQFVPASYWGCMPLWPAGTGTMSIMTGSNGCLSPASSAGNSCCSGNGSPILGKHSRATNFVEEENPGKCIFTPKTLRIDDPDEDARSPIWISLGGKHDQKDPILKGNIFRAFEPKLDSKSHIPDSNQILEANPAALSRSQTFQETT